MSEVSVNITDPNRTVEEGDVLFNGEYLLFSLICEKVRSDIVWLVDFNVWVDGEMMERVTF